MQICYNLRFPLSFPLTLEIIPLQTTCSNLSHLSECACLLKIEEEGGRVQTASKKRRHIIPTSP